jgi:hypothetical protein
MILGQLLAYLQPTLPALAVALAYLVAHPVQAAVADLGAALLADWLSGVLVAVASGTFAVAALPRILKSQLATKEALALYGLVVSAAAAAVAGGANLGLAVLYAAATGAALYSLPLWRDSAVKLKLAVNTASARALLRLAPPPAA